MTSENVETKLMYDISKLTNTTKLISSDFIDTVVIFLFREYLSDKGKDFLLKFMDQWEQNILLQKQLELDALTSGTEDSSMSDLATGLNIASMENLEQFKEEVSAMKSLLISSILAQ